ncbi:MAG: peptidase domain-containing ABC transporter [Alphaproteobacteria bacterium]
MQTLIRDESSGEQPALSSLLHALAAVARRLGVDATVQHIARSHDFRGMAPTSSQIIAIARGLNLEARSINVTWHDLPRLKKALPAILPIRGGGGLVLESIHETATAGTIAVLRDATASADVLIEVDEARLADIWDGEIILVKRRYAITDEQNPFGMRWLLGQVLHERRIFIDIAIAAIIGTVFAVAPPFLFMIVLDRVLVNHSMSTLMVVIGVILAMIAFELVFGHIRRLLTEVATTRIDGRLNLYLFERVLKLPMDYFERNPTGRIMSKLGQIWQVRQFLTGQLFGTFLDAVPLFGIIPAMLILEWRLSLLVFVLSAIIFGIVLLFMGPISQRFRRVVLAEQAKHAHLVESIYGMRTIKSLALEGRRMREWDSRVANVTAARHAFGVLANYPRTLSLPFERLIYSGSFAIGAYIVLTSPNTINPGALVAFAMLAMRMGQPLVQLARLQADLGEARAAIGEVASVLNAPPEEGRSGTGLRLPVEGTITFNDVRFRYAPESPYALNGVSFEIPQGTMLGIMGRSGSGKTTITRLLQGLHTGYEGIIKVDGMDVREIDLTHLRMNIGVVPQENFLFSGTIRENIAVARPDASFADIVRAAQMAGAEEFIERLPRGYDTILEEGAVNLSGGQRQRLAIARALLIDPPVIILDEATSALDAESEAIINANLQRIAKGRTIICISHRLSMLVPADAILVLERGEIYDIGRHEDLLQRCDIYKHLWYQQNRHVERPQGGHVQLAFSRSPEA